MGHLPIVSDKTFCEVLASGYVSTTGKLGKHWLKTIADLFSDALATRPGHVMFPWFSFTKDSVCVGFRGELIVEGKPIFVPGETYPIKIPVCLYRGIPLTEKKCLPEHKALDLWREKLLWNAIGKKSLGRGRSMVHQTSWEDEELRNLLLEEQGGKYMTEKTLKPISYRNAIPISIHDGLCVGKQVHSYSYDEKGKFIEVKWDDGEVEKYYDIKEIPIQNIRWDDGNGKFIVEKALEAWVMENIDNDRGRDFRTNVLGLDEEDQESAVCQFYNYLPFGVAGKNMDLLVITRTEDGLVFHVIELKDEGLSYGEYKKEASKALLYKEFIEEFIEKYKINACVKAKVLTGKPAQNAMNDYFEKGPHRGVNWYYYEIRCENGSARVEFHPIEYKQASRSLF